jgi:hypothetical protein
MRYAKHAIPALLALFPVTWPLAVNADSGSRDWEAEVGTTLKSYDNFFMTGDEATQRQESALVSTVYAQGQRTFKDGTRRWELEGGVEASFNYDISDADTQLYWIGAQTRLDSTRAGMELSYQPNRIFSEDGDGTFFDQTELTLSVRHEFTPIWTGQLEYARQRDEFESFARGRDADVDELSGMVRVVVHPKVALRLLAMWAQKDARDDARSWSATGFGTAIEWSPAERWSVFARARLRDREYDDALPGESNFQRDDDIFDALVSARFQAGLDWGIGGELEYRDAESTRLDRNYDAVAVSLRAFKQF